MKKSNFTYLESEIIKICINVIENAGVSIKLLDKIVVEPTKNQAHGDFSTNIALIYRGKLEANNFVEAFRKINFIEEIFLAGPGFINIKVNNKFWAQQLNEILLLKEDFGKINLGNGKFVNIEYVSANPTGPLHIGHARGAIFGDVLANLLKFVNYNVTKEYYVNDAGAQIELLVKSLYQRYLEHMGHEIGRIEGYNGDYLKSTAKSLYEKHNESLVGALEDKNKHSVIKEFVLSNMLNIIKKELNEIGIKHDIYSSENNLIESGKIDEVFSMLNEKGLIYEGVLDPPKGCDLSNWKPRKQILFKSSDFGDENDRALKKEDGSWSYLSPDIAYHFDKYKRTKGSISKKNDENLFDRLINVWGADHKGYVKRVEAALSALTDSKSVLDVKICQLVRFMENGKPFKMSKRAGTFILLSDLTEKIGKDAIRFMLASRKNDTQFDFDLLKAVEQSKDNPVFYVQYAYARCCSVLKKAKKNIISLPNFDNEKEYIKKINLSFQYYSDSDLSLIKNLANFPRNIKLAALNDEPHRIANYLYNLASEVHQIWSMARTDKNARIIDTNQKEKTIAKLILVKAIIIVLKQGLDILKVNAPDSM